MNRLMSLVIFLFTIFEQSTFAATTQASTGELLKCCGTVIEYQMNYTVTVEGKSPLVCTVGFRDEEIEKKALPIILEGLKNPQLEVCLYFYNDNEGLRSISIHPR